LSATGGNDIYCQGEYSCNYAKLLYADKIFCSGNMACTDVTRFIADSSLYCYGSFSCYGIDLSGSLMSIGQAVICSSDRSCLDAVLVVPNYANCLGPSSCKGTTIETEDVSCDSEYACSASTMTVGDKLTCYGPLSCHAATIRAPDIRAMGYKALQDASIDTDGLDTNVTVYAHGYMAGDGAEIHCRDGYKCEVDCLGNGCAGMDVYCHEGSECVLTCNWGNECACDDSDNIDCPDFPIGTTTLDVVKNEILSVKDDVTYGAIWKTTPTVVYGVLLFGFSLFLMLIYSFCIKRSQKEYQIIG